jgi:hypothetical protein
LVIVDYIFDQNTNRDYGIDGRLSRDPALKLEVVSVKKAFSNRDRGKTLDRWATNVWNCEVTRPILQGVSFLQQQQQQHNATVKE